MNRIILTACLAMSAMVTISAEKNTKPVKSAKPVALSREKDLANRMKWYGGDLIDRRAEKGSFYVINTQDAANAAILKSALNLATKDVRVTPKLINGSFDIAAPAVKGEATLFIVDDPKYPMSLVAVEGKWALVNVAKLKSDKPAFFKARVEKEIYRTVGQLFGAFSNQYDSNIFSGIFTAEDLDQIVYPEMPLEYRNRYSKYVPQMGIVQYKVVHYKTAVQEGWAPAPTNEFQKAIWEKVHAVPKNPIKIEFDPKTDK